MRDKQKAQRVAAEAARLLARDEAASIDAARRKAAARLGARGSQDLPDDGQIRDELAAYRALFGLGGDAQDTDRLRFARDAMALMREFGPELTEDPSGPAAEPQAALRILLYVEDPDSALHRLIDAGYRHRIRRSRLRRSRQRLVQVDVLEVAAGDYEVEFWPLSPALRGEPLSDSAMGDPLPRTSLGALSALG